jgi:hypothetical protein
VLVLRRGSKLPLGGGTSKGRGWCVWGQGGQEGIVKEKDKK